MDIPQTLRDKLRASQQELNQKSVIGNIVEHQVQNPRNYKRASKLADPSNDQPEGESNKLEIKYESIYMETEPSPQPLASIGEDREAELPIPLEEIRDSMWLNMDQVEFEKLEWMSTKADKLYQKQMNSSTRFDNNGKALVKDENRTVEEGHDIESLVKLLDSNYLPQVTFALNVIAKITSLASMGYYDGAFDENIYEILLSNCLLRVRHHLDSSNETICQSAIKCLRSLLCNTQVDEIILDRSHPLLIQDFDWNLWLQSIEMSEGFDEGLKDSECIKIDAVLGLVVRTSILDRFRYLLRAKEGSFSYTYYDCILDILIRMARHSCSVNYLLNDKELLSSIVEKFLPATITRESENIRPLSVKSLKLIRIISQSLTEVEERQRNENPNFKIEIKIPLDKFEAAMQSYFLIDCTNLSTEHSDSLFKLYIETVRVVKVLGGMRKHQPLVTNLVALGTPTLFQNCKLITNLDASKHLDSKISFIWQYAAHLIDLIGSFSCYERYRIPSGILHSLWSSYITKALFDWLTTLTRTKMIPHLDVSIAIATAIHHSKNFLNESEKCLSEVMLEPIIQEDNKLAGRNLNLFKVLARVASEKSIFPVFQDQSGRRRDPAGLPSFGCLMYNTSPEYKFQLCPLFDTDSPYILLNVYIVELMKVTAEKSENLGVFVKSMELNRYIRSISDYLKFEPSYESLVQQSIIAQFEVKIIANSLLLLARYYLNYNTVCIQSDFEIQRRRQEPEDVKKSRVECYSSLCHYTICAIGLLDTHSDTVLQLKDIIFDEVLFNDKLQARLAEEYYSKRNIRDISYEQENGSDLLNPPEIQLEVSKILEQLEFNRLTAIRPIYMTYTQPDRFWVLKPIIDYYSAHIEREERPELKKTDQVIDEGRWFHSQKSWRLHTGQLAVCDDRAIVGNILLFNFTMLQFSPDFLVRAIKPNLEEYLCQIGCVFLFSDLFLDPEVSASLDRNLRKILNECIDLSSTPQNIPFKNASKLIKSLGLTLADFFNKLVDQFESCSYGDIAFSNFLLLFISPQSDKIFRRKLFQERGETCLSQLRLNLDNLWSPAGLLFGAKEEDPDMLELLRRSSSFTTRCPLLSQYRAHHTKQ